MSRTIKAKNFFYIYSDKSFTNYLQIVLQLAS